jgi:hypothetical protein
MKATTLSMFVLASAAALVAQDAKREPMQGVKRGEPQPSVPTLVIGVNAAIGTLSEPGWPLIISAIWNSEGREAAPTLPADLEVKMTDERGAGIQVSFEPLRPSAAIASESERYWLASESATAPLAPGRYRISIVVPDGKTSGWRVAASDFQVFAPNPERKGALSLLNMHRSLLLDRLEDALAEADRALATNARDIQLWSAKGDILMKKDDPDAALEAYDRALNLQRKAGRESFALHKRHKEAHVRALEKRGVLPTP